MRELYFNEKDLSSRVEEWERMSWQLIEAESLNFKRWMAEHIMEEKFREVIGAGWYERTGERKAYRDGHYSRDIQLKSGRLRIKIPRAEKMSWVNPLIKKFQRNSAEFEEMVYKGFLYGMSCRGSKKYLYGVFREHVISEQGVSNIFKKFSDKVKDWHKRPITEKYKYIYWDGKYVPIRGSMKKKKVVLKVMGVKLDGRYETIDFRIARSESYLAWGELTQSLYNRGLDCNGTELFTHDGADGLIEALTMTWPDVARQQCKVHHLRNLAKRVRKINRRRILRETSRIYKANSLEHAEARAVRFEVKWKEKEPEGVRIFMKGLEPTLTFYKYGWNKEYTKEERQQLWDTISNTNILERQIEEDVRRIKPMRSFRNDDSCDRVFYAIAEEFNKNPWRMPVLTKKSQNQKSAKILT